MTWTPRNRSEDEEEEENIDLEKNDEDEPQKQEDKGDSEGPEAGWWTRERVCWSGSKKEKGGLEAGGQGLCLCGRGPEPRRAASAPLTAWGFARRRSGAEGGFGLRTAAGAAHTRRQGDGGQPQRLGF